MVNFLGWRVMSSYLSKWDSNQRLEFEPQSHLNNPWPTSTVPFLRDFPNLRAMPQGLELLADSVLTPNYNVVRANPLYNLTPSTWNSLPDAWDYSARHGHQLLFTSSYPFDFIFPWYRVYKYSLYVTIACVKQLVVNSYFDWSDLEHVACCCESNARMPPLWWKQSHFLW